MRLGDLVGADHLDAVELPATAALHELARRLQLGERHVRPGEAVERSLDAEAGARTLAVAVDARQPPVDQIVVGELGVVGDVGQVLEDLLARQRRC